MLPPDSELPSHRPDSTSKRQTGPDPRRSGGARVKKGSEMCLSVTLKNLLVHYAGKVDPDAVDVRTRSGLIGWSTAVIPKEFFEAMDPTPLYRENHSAVTAPDGAMEAVVKDREDGKIRWVGVTSYNLSTAWKPVTTGLFRSIPFSFNLLKRRQERNDNPYEKHVAGLR